VVWAHGVGQRADLPLPFWLFAYAAVVALGISFLALRLYWHRPRLAAAADGRPFVPWPSALVVAGWVVGTVVFGVVLVAAFDAPDDATSNIAPVALYVLLWVGVQVVCAVVGDVWRGLAPWAPRWWRGHADHPWAGAVGLLGFAWLELCYHAPASPRVVGIALVVWIVMSLTFGDPFAVWFRLVAAIAPIRRVDGRLRLRPPGAGLATVVGSPAVAAVVLVALGSTAFDGLTRTSWWADVQQGRDGWNGTLVSSVGLLFAVLVVALLFRSAMEITARLTGEDADELTAAYVPSLVPIALGYVVAHYFSLFVFEGQTAIALASDPFARGWDLFGTVDRRVDYLLVSTDTIAWVQAGAVVAGHVAGVVVAHDRAVERHGRDASRSQYPLLAVMVAYTVGGLALLLNA
jgi:hypothetical protein